MRKSTPRLRQGKFHHAVLYQFHHFNLFPANPEAPAARSMLNGIIERKSGAEFVQMFRHQVAHGQENLKLAVETKERL